MAVDPPEDAICMVTDFASVDRETAIKYLRIKQNDAEKAISALLDGENLDAAINSITWDESAWRADRDGVPQAPQKQFSHSAAPTRGSSPAPPSLLQPKTRADEDEEMERALAMSRQDLGYGAQQNGTVDSTPRTIHTVQRATGNDHDPNKWALTLSNNSTTVHHVTELMPEVDPRGRRHQPNVPRFLRPTPTADYLPNLLTIGHSIPMMRETWLMRSATRSTYGQDSEWWRGVEIKAPQTVPHADRNPDGSMPNNHDHLVAEMQRLMAFLDGSTRLYASAQPLMNIVRARGGHAGTLDSVLDRTLRSWEAAAQITAPEQSEQIRAMHSVLGSGDTDSLDSPDLWTLPLKINIETEPQGATISLAEAMHHALWNDDSNGSEPHDAFMERCAHVLVMRITQASRQRSTLGLIIPPELYVDKYLKENIESARSLRKQMGGIRHRMARLEQILSRLQSIQHPVKSNIDASAAIEHALKHYSGANREAVIAEREARGTQVDIPALPQQYATVLGKLQTVCQTIEAKMIVLRNETTQGKQLLAELSRSGPSGPPKHRYVLRGVATKPSVTYVLRPRPDTDPEGPTLLDAASNDDPDCPPGMQWWRIELDVPHSGIPRVLTTISTADDVLRAVELEHNAALLVYASEYACNYAENTKLPDPLQDFIDRDNAAFEAELRQEKQDPELPAFDWSAPAEHGPSERRTSFESTTVNFDDRNDLANDVALPSYDSLKDMSVDAPRNDDAKVKQGLTEFVLPDHAAMPGLLERAESPPAHDIILDDTDENVSVADVAASTAAKPDTVMVDVGPDEAAAKRKRE